jgi:hypothetical protein
MPMGGHYAYGSELAGTVWEKAFTDFVKKLPPDEEYRLVCHSRAELAVARRLFPEMKVFWSSDYRDYLAFFAGAKYGILNRVHAAFALASFGRPSFVVGSDSRAQMSEIIGLRHAFVGDVTVARLTVESERLRSNWGAYSEGMIRLQSETELAYLEALREALPEFDAPKCG